MDEVMKLANEENVDLSDEQLEFLTSGGCCSGCYEKGRKLSIHPLHE